MAGELEVTSSEVTDPGLSAGEENLWDLSDEELEARVQELKGQPATSASENDEGTTSTDVVTIETTDATATGTTEQPTTDAGSDNKSVTTDGTEATTEISKEQVTADAKEPEATTQATTTKRKYKANGKEFEFTDQDIFDKFGQVFGQAMDYTKKMQAIAPYRTMISAIEDAKISKEDLNLAIEVLKGDKQATAALLKRTGVNALELDTEAVQDYQPKNYGRSETELNIQDVISSISGDPEASTTLSVLNSQWDTASVERFAKEPELIKELHLDIKSGVYSKVAPMAEAMKVFDNGRKSDLDYYIAAGTKYYADLEREQFNTMQAEKTRMAVEQAAQQAKAEAMRAESERLAKLKAEETQRQQQAALDVKRRAAAPTASMAGTKGAKDYLAMTDEDFDSWYNNLVSKQ